ncbi:hypothetical protein D3C81_2297010 [compost metagenome]
MAREKARVPSMPGICRLMYCPAWNAMGRSSFRRTPLMVGERSSSAITTAL